MTRIVLISDTHIPAVGITLPKVVLDEIKKSDLVMHLGDFISYDFYKDISILKPLKAVAGNMDETKLQKLLPTKDIITVENVKIGLIHGLGFKTSIIGNVSSAFDEAVDIIAFGHTHMPYNKKNNNILFFNPGSPTDKIFTSYNSYGILEIDDQNIKSYIIKI